MSAIFNPADCIRKRIVSIAKAILLLVGFSAIGLYSFGQLVGTRFSIDETGTVELQYFGSDDAYYILKRGDSLVGVFTIRDIVLGEASMIDFTEGVTPLQTVFYQLDEVPLARPLDSDKDGIDDAFELAHPGILDPLDPNDSLLDADSDGISNFEEYVRGTDIAAISNIAPSVGLTTPKSGSGFLTPASITLKANASDRDGTISRVEFYQGNTKIGEDTTAPYETVWTDVVQGEYVVTAVAVDDAGSSTRTFGSFVEVIDGASQPLTRVAITSPRGGEQGVAVTRETIITFSNPLANDAVVDGSVINVTKGGVSLGARYEISEDRRKIRVFYSNKLPSNSRINVRFSGSLVNDLLGRAIDADRNGEAGGDLEFFFDTLNTVSFANTAVCGRVFASQLAPGNDSGSVNVPLGGVKVSVDGQEETLFTFTDEFGDFRLENAPAGRFFVHIDGREVLREADGIRYPDLAYYPNVGKAWVSIPNEEVNIGEVYLPLINKATLQAVSADDPTLIGFPLDVIRINPELKDVQIEVPANSLFRDDGTRGGMVGIAPVPPDRLPGQLPEGLDFPIVITVQTDGATNFDTPVPICFPNLEGLAPGTKSALWSFNHDTGKFEVVGPSTVSDDGKLICTDPGVGIVAPGWHGTGDGTPPDGDPDKDKKERKKKKKPEPTEEQECNIDDEIGECACTSEDRVLLHSGEEILERTDLAIPGRAGMDFKFVRTYRSQLNYDGPMGFGWTFNYDEGLFFEENGDIVRSNSNAHLDRWEIQDDGTYKAPKGHFRDLIRGDDGTYILRDSSGFQRFYDEDGRLFCYQDRFGNLMLFDHDVDGNLSKVIDVYGREIDFEFQTFPDGQDRLVKITDFVDREVEYTYDANGDLIEVRSPVVTGTSNGNDFPDGRTEQYTYSSGFAEPELNHNLLSCTMPEEVANGGPPAMQWIYGNNPADPLTFDKVTSETIGGTNASGIAAGGTRSFTYEMLNQNEPAGQPDLPRGKATITERNGNTMEYFVNEFQHHILTRQLTRGFREGEPDFYETRSIFDEDGLLLRRINPEGNVILYTYDSEGPRHMRSNVLEMRQVADVNRGGGEDLITTYTYEPLFNRISTTTDPRGNATDFQPPLGVASPERYTTRYFFDYQESNDPVDIADLFGIDLSAVERGLGDLNGDGRTDQTFGNLVRAAAPSVLLRADSNQASRLGSTEQVGIAEYQWNDRGQRTAEIDQEGNVTEYLYYPENDPDGDGIVTPSIYRALNADRIGYLAAVVADARDSSRRTSTVDPLALKSESFYDPVGNLIRGRDPRGIVSTYEVNALNETVSITAGSQITDAVNKGELITGESAFGYRLQMTRDHNGRVVLNEVENRDGNSAGAGLFIEHLFTYDILGNTVKNEKEVDDQNSVITEYRYDANENLVLIREPAGNEVATTYDERDLVHTITQGSNSPDTSTTTMDYDMNGNRIRATDAEDNDGDGNAESTLSVYDGFDRVVVQIDALGNETVRTYDVAGNIVRSQLFGHPAGQPNSPNVLHEDTFYFHDELNRGYRIDDSLFVADGFNPSRAPNLSDSDGNGLVTDFFEFDALSRQTHSIEDDGQTTETVYDGLSRVVASIDPIGNMSVTDYDSNSNPIRESELEVSESGLVADEGYETHYVYDQLNRLVRATDNAGQTTRFTYDSRNNLIGISDPVGPATNDPLGLFPGVINGPGNTSTYIYDGLSRRITEINDIRTGGEGSGPIDTSNSENSDGQVAVRYEWDDNSRLSALVDDNGNRTTYTYDALNRMVSQTNAKVDEVTTLVYDRDSNVIEVVDPNGTSSIRSYDALNRPVSVSIDRAAGVEGTTEELFEYDGLSRLTKTSDNNGGAGSEQELEFVYDSLSRVIEEQQNGQPISSVYAGDGRRVESVLPGGRTVTQTFDLIDRVKEIKDTTTAENLIARMDWIGPGLRELRRSHGNGTAMTLLNDASDAVIGFDAVKRITRSKLINESGDLLLDREYGYNRADVNLFERRNDDGGLVDAYTYDSLYRIVSSSFDTGVGGVKRATENLTYTYDGVGNRKSVNETNSQTGNRLIDYVVNEVNEYTAIDSTQRTHSKNGNLLDDGTREFVYDYKNRLVRVENKGTGETIASYLYHSDNRRSVKSVGDLETRYFYDGWQVCEEQSASGNTLVTYLYSPTGLDVPVQLQRTGNHPLGAADIYLHQNANYDVVASTDEAGAVVEKRYYDDFGRMYDEGKNLVSTSDLGNPYGFQGRRLDPETGLYYYRNRYYDPDTGRFLQRDPVRDSGNFGNQYTLVGNSPVSSYDPLGLQECDRGSLVRERKRLKNKLWHENRKRDELFEKWDKLSEEIDANQAQLKILRGLLAGKSIGSLLAEMGWTAVPYSTEIDLVTGRTGRGGSAATLGATKGGEQVVLKLAPKLAKSKVLWVTGAGAMASIVGQWIGQVGTHFYERSWIKSHIETYMGIHNTQMQLSKLYSGKADALNKSIRDLENELKEIERKLRECNKRADARWRAEQARKDEVRRKREAAEARRKARMDRKRKIQETREYNARVKAYNEKVRKIRNRQRRAGHKPTVEYAQYRRYPR